MKLQNSNNPLRKFISDEDGATAVEYALLCSLLFLVILAAMQNVGTNTTTMFNKIGTSVSTAR